MDHVWQFLTIFKPRESEVKKIYRYVKTGLES